MNGFWLSPSCQRIDCLHHFAEAVRIAGNLYGYCGDYSTEILLTHGWLRCVVSTGDLFYERRPMPNEKQMAELMNIAMESDLRLFGPRGELLYEPAMVWTS